MKTETFIMRSKAMILVMLFTLSINTLFAQREEIITIPWGSPKSFASGEGTIQVPYIVGQSFDGVRPNFDWRKPVGSNSNYTLSVEVMSSAPATKVDLTYLTNNYISVGELDFDLGVANSNTDRNIALRLFPYIKVNNVISRITSVKLSYDKALNIHPATIQKDFVANSVLQSGSGSWYKISVTNDGIYKIDKAFLQQCGINTASLNPQHINIYGNGDGRLPELNSVPRTDDLAKNAIQIIGENDGVFNDNDYILFYGWGPHRWYDDGAKFNRDRNPYSDISTYFINVNASDPPSRISILPNSSNSVTDNVSTYSYYDVYEQDVVSLVHGGQRWYGDLFDTDLQQTFNFNVPNIDSSFPARFDLSIASNSNGTSGNTIKCYVNGTQIGDGYLPGPSTDYKRAYSDTLLLNSPTSNLPFYMAVTRSSPDVLTYLDRIQLNARRNLAFTSSQFNFRDLNSVGTGSVAEYSISGFPSNGFVWEVTDRHAPRLIDGVNAGNYVFQSDSDSLRHFVASNGVNFYSPNFEGAVISQNLHGLEQADYLIVTNALFISQANRLADLHRANGVSVHVVTDEQVFNEFSSGMKDATAIRMFAKMFYDRGAADPATRPKSLLLFGDGTYDPKDRVENNNNYILTYQVANSEDHIAALVTDDYYGLLDDNEQISALDDVDIGIGRLLISTTTMAKEQVDKVQHYMHNGSDLYSSEVTNCSAEEGVSTFGDWRAIYTQISDDEESQFISDDCERQYDTVTMNHPEMNCEKIYMDAYQQVITAGGQRYPDVVDAINDRIERGTLVLNYVGHGGEVGVAEERIITVPQIQDWRNINRLPLMVSATCEFTKYDDPDRVSAGEWASINPYGAAIALMTTTRSVYYGVNEATGRAFYRNVFVRDADHQPKTFGEIIRLTKNLAGNSLNKRSFTLIGDPALQIALPRMNVLIDSINGLSPAVEIDTIRALTKVTIKGHVEDFNGSTLSGFNGVVYPTVFDKPKIQQTLQNDPGAPLVEFETQTNRLYRGKATVQNGYFEFTFVVPKDINYAFDFGKISCYAENGTIDALGEEQRVYVGGVNPNGINDSEGPQIELFLNDESFVNGGITDETPRLIAKLFDENGINAVGNGIGHDLTVILDDESSNPIVLNDYYVADLDSYQSGRVAYNFSNLEPGNHSLTLKVWDVNNNSSEARLEFVVKELEDMSIEHVLNYPNPFTTHTEFFFEHNQVCSALETQIQIFTVSGRLVRTINEMVHTDGYRSHGIAWDGRDDFGDQLAKGVYVYRVTVKSPYGSSAEKLEKLVILK